MGLINNGWYGMFFACGIWCLADVSSVSPSSEQSAVFSDERLTLETSAKHHIPCTGEKHTISTLVDQTHIQRTRPRRKTVFLKTSFSAINRNKHILYIQVNHVCIGKLRVEAEVYNKMESDTQLLGEQKGSTLRTKYSIGHWIVTVKITETCYWMFVYGWSVWITFMLCFYPMEFFVFRVEGNSLRGLLRFPSYLWLYKYLLHFDLILAIIQYDHGILSYVWPYRYFVTYFFLISLPGSVWPYGNLHHFFLVLAIIQNNTVLFPVRCGPMGTYIISFWS